MLSHIDMVRVILKVFRASSDYQEGAVFVRFPS